MNRNVTSYIMETNNGNISYIEYDYQSDRIIKTINRVKHIYYHKNGRIVKYKVSESEIKYNYSLGKLVKINRITGDEESETNIKWNCGNISEVYTTDNYLGDHTDLWNKTSFPNHTSLIFAICDAAFSNEIDIALMTAGYFGHSDKYLPFSTEYATICNGTHIYHKNMFSYTFNSLNYPEKIVITDSDGDTTKIYIEWI